MMNLKKYPFFHIHIKKINNINEISKPKLFHSNSFPSIIKNHIDKLSLYEIVYSFSMTDRNIKIHFIVEHVNPEKKISMYNKYVEWMIMCYLC
jgi:hypothetical protein